MTSKAAKKKSATYYNVGKSDALSVKPFGQSVGGKVSYEYFKGFVYIYKLMPSKTIAMHPAVAIKWYQKVFEIRAKVLAKRRELLANGKNVPKLLKAKERRSSPIRSANREGG